MASSSNQPPHKVESSIGFKTGSRTFNKSQKRNASTSSMPIHSAPMQSRSSSRPKRASSLSSSSSSLSSSATSSVAAAPSRPPSRLHNRYFPAPPPSLPGKYTRGTSLDGVHEATKSRVVEIRGGNATRRCRGNSSRSIGGQSLGRKQSRDTNGPTEKKPLRENGNSRSMTRVEDGQLSSLPVSVGR